MLTRTAIFYLLFFALVSCSNSNQREEAQKHFDLIQQVIEPWVTSTNNMVKETIPILRRSYDNGGKLNSVDSLKILNALTDFNKSSDIALKQFDSLETFEGYDLKKPTAECVSRVTKLVQETFKEALTHSYSQTRTSEQMDGIKDEFKKEFIATTEYYFRTQNDFKKKFNIE